MPSFEVLLPIGAIAFYLYDSALLLYGNELVLERARRGWQTSIGLPLQFGRRRPFVPNPLTPGALLFRARWDRESLVAEGDALDAEVLRDSLAPLQRIVTLQALLMFAVLPPVSVLLGAGSLLLAVFLLYYVLTLAGLGILIAKRRAFHVSVRRAAWLSVESLLCGPFAANLVRKVSLARSDDLDWLKIAQIEFSRDAKNDALHAVETRITELLVVEEPGSPGSNRLESIRQTLKERLCAPVVA